MLVVAPRSTKSLILASWHKDFAATFTGILLLYWSNLVAITCSVLFLQFIATVVATSPVAAGLELEPLWANAAFSNRQWLLRSPNSNHLLGHPFAESFLLSIYLVASNLNSFAHASGASAFRNDCIRITGRRWVHAFLTDEPNPRSKPLCALFLLWSLRAFAYFRLIKKSRMRHQSFFQAGALWCVMILDLLLDSARKKWAWMLGVVVIFNSMFVVGKPCSSC